MSTGCHERIEKIVAAYRASDQHKKFIEEIHQYGEVPFLASSFIQTRKFHATWFTQFWRILKRSCKVLARHPVLMKARLFQSFCVSLLIGFIYLNTDMKYYQNVGGVVFFVVLNQSVSSLTGTLQVFPLEKPLYLREYGAGMYRVDAYFLAKCLSDIPLQLTFPTIFSLIIYILVGLPLSSGRMLMYWISLLLVVNAALCLGFLVSAFAASLAVALTIGPMFLLPLILFGGFFLNLGDIPWYFTWLKIFSFLAYGMTALCDDRRCFG